MIILLLAFQVFAVSNHDFVDIKTMNANIEVEARYSSRWNFIGRKITGYNANKCILTKKAASALSEVQNYLEQKGLSLLVFDCYRPQRAVTEFLNWTEDSSDTQMQKIFYPGEPKNKLVERGYIAAKSGHSRGSTVDLTIVKTKRHRYHEAAADCRKNLSIEASGQLDMGTTYDCFDKLAHTSSPEISEKAKDNRQLLKTAMEKFGFVNYSKEWWHYTLKNEPYPNTYFDLIIQ